MDSRDKLIIELHGKIDSLQSRIQFLEDKLKQANISFESIEEDPHLCEKQRANGIVSEIITQNHARFFYSMFHGRNDVYSKRSGKINPKTGKVGYYTQCNNFWRYGVCPKAANQKQKCNDCAYQSYKKLDGNAIMNHLNGTKEDCSDVIGIYPMLKDETCYFLVFDFDNHLDNEDELNVNWVEEVNALREICRVNNVDCLVERSRSGNGAHLWLFFNEPIKVVIARKFGSALLTKGAESVNQKTFSSYDRMIPSQDTMPEGGLGNLVALPLQGRALKEGNSAFVDEYWNAYSKQWEVLKNVTKLSKEFVETKINEWGENGILGELSTDLSGEEADTKPWEIKNRFKKDDISEVVNITLANQIFIDIQNMKPRMQNQIRRLAAFSNPEFYKKQAMGFSVRGISRIISCSEEQSHFIGIPRGLKEKLEEKLIESEIPYSIEDYQQKGKIINVSFKGKLYPAQQKAADIMLQYENGILAAATAFGKTAVGAYLISERKVNTLVLVNNTEILKNWIEDLEKFLLINEEVPTYITPKGKIKKRKSVIGSLQANHNSLTGIVDVAMLPSLGKKDNILPIVKEYGMVIMDECHHGAALTSDMVLREVSAKYVYGLSATPKRMDGLEQKIYMQLGPIRYRYSAKEKALEQGINHYVLPRFTRYVHSNGECLKLNEAYKEIIESNVRNSQIIKDIEHCVEAGRTPIVITKFKSHALYLYNQLQDSADHIFLMQGGRTSKQKDEIRKRMKEVPINETVILVAIGQYIGEGFNYPRLDTMMLTVPISFDGKVEQYVGRLHRDFEGKKDVIIYDYVDSHVRVLESMYHKRLRAYKKIGYEICTNWNTNEEFEKNNLIYDNKSYIPAFKNDLLNARKEIVISSPGINTSKVKAFIKQVVEIQEKGIRIIILTLSSTKYPISQCEKTKKLIAELKQNGIEVREYDRIHEHCAIIDTKLVWYGSANLLSKEKEEDNMIRLISEEISIELMKLFF